MPITGRLYKLFLSVLLPVESLACPGCWLELSLYVALGLAKTVRGINVVVESTGLLSKQVDNPAL